MSWDIDAFVEKLENNHTFPGDYTFKFIVKPEHQTKVEALVKGAEITLKPSSGNKYVSVTIKAHLQTSKEVVEIYQEAKKIEGIISL
ncbi:MAG: DUF493 domain-containing protein [Bacteroidota bacterium]